MEPPVWGRIVEAVRSEGAVESDVLAAIPGWCECERVEEEVWECAGWRCCRLCMVLVYVLVVYIPVNRSFVLQYHRVH